VNTAEIAAAAIPASLVLSSGTVALALRSAVRKGCTVTAGMTFKLAPPPQPDTFKADARTFQASLDEALAGAAETVRAAVEAAQPAAEPSPGAPPATAVLTPAGKAA
jgi:hypothetical protein